MCEAGKLLAKLARLAGELEYELTQALADQCRSDTGQFRAPVTRARLLLLAQGDPWALAVFERVSQRVLDNPGRYQILAEGAEERPADSVEAALARAREVLT